MRYLFLMMLAFIVISCKQTYSYEGQKRGGDPYQVEWITQGNSVETCFLIDSGKAITTTNGLEISSHKFIPDGGKLYIYDISGSLVESPQLKDWIYYCSSKGYSKIPRCNKISDLIEADYKYMTVKLVDYLKTSKSLP